MMIESIRILTEMSRSKRVIFLWGFTCSAEQDYNNILGPKNQYESIEGVEKVVYGAPLNEMRYFYPCI